MMVATRTSLTDGWMAVAALTSQTDGWMNLRDGCYLLAADPPDRERFLRLYPEKVVNYPGGR
jgi:hypothetical protein